MHLEKLPSGRWRVTVDRDRERRRATADTRSEAQRLGAELLLEMGGRRERVTVTMGDLIDEHLAAVADEWSPTTWAEARRVVAGLPAVFRARNVADVDAVVLTALYRELGRAEWSPFKVRRAHTVISTAFGRAVSYGWVRANPARDAKVPKTPQRDISPPTLDVVRKLLDACDDPPVGLFVRLAATTGARRGELVGLQWTAIDLPARSLSIRRAVVYAKGVGLAERDTKTGRKGHRNLSLDAATATALTGHRATQLDDAVWVFSHDGGTTPWQPTWITHEFGRLCKRAEIEGVRLHDLRHFVATSMLYDGDSAHEVAARLGHASTSTTLGVYSHWVRGADRDVADRLGARL